MSQQTKSLQEISHNCSTIVDVLRLRSSTQPEHRAFTFLEDGESQETTLTYQELDRRSRTIASQLQAMGMSGERALLLYPSGLDYLSAFFGCLYAGVIAVPAFPPHNQRKTSRIQAIVADAQASLALTTTPMLPTVQSILVKKTDQKNLRWLVTDNLAQGLEDSWQQPLINTDTIAFLQYTSGSTGVPKGVILNHSNLLHNAATTYQFMEHSPTSQFISWLPIYHDMGLIGGILQPLYGGFNCVFMSPASFLQRPYRWLQAISRYKGTTSGGPNFAYEQCIQRISQEQKATLDLSSWSVAFNGAEPVRHETLERFAEAFAECGFRKEAFYPCYGMAETTLMVSGVEKATAPKIKTVQKSALECDRLVKLSSQNENFSHFVSCGRVIPKQKVVIANPETLSSCKPDEIGEIWVAGPSVGQGYWNREQETQETFHAYLSDTGEGPFLRTGDLGFLDNGELFITGRAKDLIIIRGRNLYPQDIELTAERSHSSLRPGANAAFTVEVNQEERLFIVQELEFRAKPNLAEVISAIRQAITEEHEIQVYGVVLIKPGSISKTSSGKIQRRATRAQFENNQLNVVASNILKISEITRKETRLQRYQLLSLSPRECQLLLEAYLIELLAGVISIAPDDINPQAPLSTLGLDSLKVFELKNRIEIDLEVEVSVADLFEGMSVRSLVTKILAQMATDGLPSLSLTQQQRNTSIHPLSFAQQGLWFINQLNPHTPTYNIPVIINLKGCINLTVLQDSLNEIIRRHEVLRTSFTVVDGKPVQVINQALSLTLTVEDLRILSESERTQKAQHLAAEFAQQPFDLSTQSLLRAKILQLSDKNYQLILVLHHIIADGWSIGVLIKELTVLYEAFSTEKLSPLADLPIQYRDFVNWQRQWMNCERIQPLLTYWKQKLQGELTVLNLPTDRPRSPIQTFKGAQAKLVLSQTLTKELKNLSRQQGVTLFMALLTAFKILLYRYTGQTDIIVGSPIANRNRAEIEPLIGLFVNILVLRTDLSGDLSFQELLGRVKSTALEAYVHQDLPFEKLVEELQPSRDLSYNPLFQVMFVLQNLPKPNLSLSDVSVSYEEGYNGTSKFDLTLFMQDCERGLIATCEYNTDLFNADTINRMLGHFQTLLESIVSNPKQCISQLQLLTPSEIKQLLIDWNDTKIDSPQDKCIHQLFEEQVEKTPDAVALIFDDQKLTYRDLNSRANQVAHYLQQLDVKPDVLVGICVERSIEMVVGLLAIMKAGGAYMPLDPAYPKERLAFILKDTQITVLLTKQHLKEKLPEHEAQVVCLDSDLDIRKINQHTQDNPVSSSEVNNLAYVIYTSGSTGEPKGVLGLHKGAINRFEWMWQNYPFVEEEVCCQKTSLNFVDSVWEIFGPLLQGVTIVIIPDMVFKDPQQFVTTLFHKNVTRIVLVPSLLRILLNTYDFLQLRLPKLKLWVCSGEALSTELLMQFRQSLPDSTLLNLYGSSEVSADVTCYNISPEAPLSASVSIGRPIANTQIYILDTNKQPVPVGVSGQIYIGGDGLARGYLNRPDLTAEKFISNPFSDNFAARLYQTGDLARYLPNGEIEYIGRIDYQVKVRGFRIELGEIEALINQHPAVQETVVVAREDVLNGQLLVGYLVTHKEAKLSVNELRNFLKEKLPEYMVPSTFVVLDTLPLTPNGKVDHRALPAPENLRPDMTAAFQPPQSEIEKIIAQVWQKVLHLEKVGIHDNFFDLGGHSLIATQIVAQLSQYFHIKLSLRRIFEAPTVAELALVIEDVLIKELEELTEYEAEKLVSNIQV